MFAPCCEPLPVFQSCFCSTGCHIFPLLSPPLWYHLNLSFFSCSLQLFLYSYISTSQYSSFSSSCYCSTFQSVICADVHFSPLFMADLLYITLPKRISFFWTRDVNLSKVSPRICLYFSLSGQIALEELLCDMNR